jgi:cardiolipin synthase
MIKEDLRINIPNLISLVRLLSVPLNVWLIMNDDLLACFWLFILAGISDAADGFIAKRYNLQTELGAYLDPIADKSLLVSVFVTLGYA